MVRLKCMCINCGSATDVLEVDFNIYDVNKENATKIVRCRQCQKEYKIEEGIIESIVNDSYFSDYDIVSDTNFMGKGDIEVGKSYEVKLERPIPKIREVNVTTHGNFRAKADYQNMGYNGDLIDSFCILTSESYSDTSDKLKIGDKSSLAYSIYACDKSKFPVWLQFLREAKNALIDGNYTLAILSAEISFESYVDNTLTELFLSKGLDKEVAYVIQESMSRIGDKVYKLLSKLGNINFKGQKELSKNWKDLVELRNKIAHGEKINHSKEEAYKAFKTVVRSIFYINRESPFDNIYILFNNEDRTKKSLVMDNK